MINFNINNLINFIINRKYFFIIAIGAVIVIIGIIVFFVFHFDIFSSEIPLEFSVEKYDIQRDYCGKALDIHYCQCAFEGENCEKVSISDKDTAKNLVIAGFESWLNEKKREECSKKGGRWIGNVCRK